MAPTKTFFADAGDADKEADMDADKDADRDADKVTRQMEDSLNQNLRNGKCEICNLPGPETFCRIRGCRALLHWICWPEHHQLRHPERPVAGAVPALHHSGDQAGIRPQETGVTADRRPDGCDICGIP